MTLPNDAVIRVAVKKSAKGAPLRVYSYPRGQVGVAKLAVSAARQALRIPNSVMLFAVVITEDEFQRINETWENFQQS